MKEENHQTLQELKRRTKEVLSQTRGSHAWDHTERVYNLSMHIGKTEKANLKILQYAALLHDIGRPYEDRSKGGVCHAIKGSQLARDILGDYDLNEQEIDLIVECIKTHRFRGENKPSFLEAKILFDADKLDSIGAVGIGRAFLFAGEVGAKLHNKDVDIEKTEAYTNEDTAYREYRVKLCKILDRMQTNEGRRLAEDRHQFMEDFFLRLNKEVEGEI